MPKLNIEKRAVAEDKAERGWIISALELQPGQDLGLHDVYLDILNANMLAGLKPSNNGRVWEVVFWGEVEDYDYDMRGADNGQPPPAVLKMASGTYVRVVKPV